MARIAAIRVARARAFEEAFRAPRARSTFTGPTPVVWFVDALGKFRTSIRAFLLRAVRKDHEPWRFRPLPLDDEDLRVLGCK